MLFHFVSIADVRICSIKGLMSQEHIGSIGVLGAGVGVGMMRGAEDALT